MIVKVTFNDGQVLEYDVSRVEVGLGETCDVRIEFDALVMTEQAEAVA